MEPTLRERSEVTSESSVISIRSRDDVPKERTQRTRNSNKVTLSMSMWIVSLPDRRSSAVAMLLI